jgi:hypothetical protein
MNDQQLLDFLLRFLRREGRTLWQELRLVLDPLPPTLRECVELLPEVFAAIERDNACRDKREVYLVIAKLLQEKLGQPLPVCLATTHLLCGEADPKLLEDGAPGGDRLLTDARALLLAIKVHYGARDARTFHRKTEVYFLDGGQPAVAAVDEARDVRESRLREGAEVVTFKLYPREG